MSQILRGVRFPDDDAVRDFGYLAFFEDGDIRKHAKILRQWQVGVNNAL